MKSKRDYDKQILLLPDFNKIKEMYSVFIKIFTLTNMNIFTLTFYK